MEDSSHPPVKAIVALAVLVLAIAAGAFWNYGMYTRVTAGEACVLLKHGSIKGTAGPGKHFDPPWGTKYECRETRPQSAEVGDHEAEADYGRGPLSTTTSNGTSVTLTAQIRYITPTDSLATLYAEGARTQEKVWSDIVQKEVEEALVSVTNRTPIGGLYPEFATAGDEMERVLVDGLGRWGITLDNFFLTGVTPPDAYRETISQQQAEIENQELARAQQETIRVNNENGVLSAEGEAAAAKAKAEGEAQVTLINANAEAKSNTIVDASLTENVLYAKYIETLPSTNWAIFSPEDVQPTTAIPSVEEDDATEDEATPATPAS